jgi:hypothetical protein
MTGAQKIWLLIALIVGWLLYSTYGNRHPVNIIAYDLTNEKSYFAQFVSRDSDHGIILFSPDIAPENGLLITWNDCPEFDVNGTRTGRRLPASQCHAVNG